MIIYIQVLRPTGTNRCMCSDCYMCPQGGCSVFPHGEVRIAHPDVDDIMREADKGRVQVLRVILSESEKRVLNEGKTATAERGTQCRL